MPNKRFCLTKRTPEIVEIVLKVYTVICLDSLSNKVIIIIVIIVDVIIIIIIINIIIIVSSSSIKELSNLGKYLERANKLRNKLLEL